MQFCIICLQSVNNVCAIGVEFKCNFVCNLCEIVVQFVCHFCEMCVQFVCKLSAICIQSVFNMCAFCVQFVWILLFFFAICVQSMCNRCEIIAFNFLCSKLLSPSVLLGSLRFSVLGFWPEPGWWVHYMLTCLVNYSRILRIKYYNFHFMFFF